MNAGKATSSGNRELRREKTTSQGGADRIKACLFAGQSGVVGGKATASPAEVVKASAKAVDEGNQQGADRTAEPAVRERLIESDGAETANGRDGKALG